MKYILNEKKYIENLIENKANEQIEKPGALLPLLAQYYYEFKGYRKKKITDLLIDFLNTRYPSFEHNKKSWIETCAKIAKTTGGKPLLQVDELSITQKEIETITQNVNDKSLERLLFVMLCIAKYNNLKNPKNQGWVNTDLKDLFTLAKVKSNPQNRGKIIHTLINTGLIETAKRIDKVNLKVCFIDTDDNKNTVLFTMIKDFRELGFQYNRLMNYGDYFTCEKCGITVKANKQNNNKKCMCKKCLNEPKTRLVICVDCGAPFTVDARVSAKCRCDECQKIKIREDATKRKQRQREREKLCVSELVTG